MSSAPEPLRIPEDPQTRIWRYMDFMKFMHLVDSRSLFFARSDRLGDDHECTYPQANFDAFSGTPLEANNKTFLAMTRMVRSMFYVNCWHMNEDESTAMWDIYGTDGVAIQTTFGRLRSALLDGRRDVSLGMVNYVDYGKERINDQNIYQFVLHKRKHFEHERELRALIWDRSSSPGLLMPIPTDEAIERQEAESPPGISVQVDLGFVEAIYVSPKSPTWFRTLVESLVGKLGLRIIVAPSRLSRKPLR